MTPGRIEAAQRARRSATEHKHQLVTAAITELLRTGNTLSISAVARLAGTSRGFVTTHHQATIERAIAEHAGQLAAASATRPSAASLKAENATLRDQAKALSAENRALRQRLSRTLGDEVTSTSLPHERADPAFLARLQAEVEGRDQRIFELEEQQRSLVEDLEAARTANRRLLKQLNERATP